MYAFLADDNNNSKIIIIINKKISLFFLPDLFELICS